MSIHNNQDTSLNTIAQYLQHEEAVHDVEVDQGGGFVRGHLINRLCTNKPHALQFSFSSEEPPSMLLCFPELLYLPGPGHFAQRIAWLNYGTPGILGRVGLDDDGEVKVVFRLPMQGRHPSSAELATFRSRLSMMLEEATEVHARALEWIFALGFDRKSVEHLLTYARDCLSTTPRITDGTPEVG